MLLFVATAVTTIIIVITFFVMLNLNLLVFLLDVLVFAETEREWKSMRLVAFFFKEMMSPVA